MDDIGDNRASSRSFSSPFRILSSTRGGKSLLTDDCPHVVNFLVGIGEKEGKIASRLHDYSLGGFRTRLSGYLLISS